MTGLPCSITKKGPLQKKEASLLTFSITSLIKVLVSLSKFAERQLVVIETRNKPGKKNILCTSHSAVISSLRKDLGTQNWISIFAWSPGLQRWTANDSSTYFIGPWGTWFIQLQTNKFQGLFKPFSNLQITVSRTTIFFKPLLNTLLVKTHHGVIYDLNFFSHGWPHYFILISEQNLAKWLVEKAIKSVKTNFIRMSWCTEKYLDKGIVVWRTTCVSEFWPMVTCRNWLNKYWSTHRHQGRSSLQTGIEVTLIKA